MHLCIVCSALFDDGSTGLPGQTSTQHKRVWPRPRDTQGAEERDKPGFTHHQGLASGHRMLHDKSSGARAPLVADLDGASNKVLFLDV